MGHHRILGQRGMALPIAILALVVLTTLVTAYLSLGAFEPQVSRNLTDGTRVRFVAEAGIEFGFNSLASNSDWTSLLQANNGVLASTTAIPGLTSASGTYTVTLRNDVCAAASACNALGDTSMTGVALDTGNQNGAGAVDTNNVVIMTSVATLGTATKTITVVVGRANLPPVVAALAFPGISAQTSFTGNAFAIKGTDTNPDDSAGSATPVFGIAVSSTLGTPPGSNEGAVESTVSGTQSDNIVGRNQSGVSTGTGDRTIVAEGSLTQSAISNFVAAAKSIADISLTSTPDSPQSLNNVGDTCAANLASSTCWGTTANPKVVYVKGTADASDSYTTVSLGGHSSGAGILIIEDGDLDIHGDFRWEGLIIVTGQFVGVSYRGGGNQAVYGAVIANETASPRNGFSIDGDFQGNISLLYSSQAIRNAQNARKLVRIYSWRES